MAHSDELATLRERLAERTAWDFDEDRKMVKVPCFCAQDRKPCTYHEGVVDGVDKVLAMLVEESWHDAHGYCDRDEPIHSAHHHPVYRIKDGNHE